MVNSKKIIASLGVVAGLGVAVLPLTSYAVEGEGVVKVGVEDSLAVTVTANYAANVTGGDDYMAVKQGEEKATLIHTVNVKGTTRHDYALTMHAKDNEKSAIANNILVHSDVDTAQIAPTAGAASLAKGTWGYKYSTDSSSFSGNWKPVALTAATGSLKTASSTDRTAAYDENHYVNFGVNAADDQRAGYYEATVVYTATAASAL